MTTYRFIPRTYLTADEWLGAEAGVTLPPLREPLAQRVRAWLRRVRRRLDGRRFAFVAGALVAAAGFGNAAYIEAKAGVAQALLREAWTRSLATGDPQRPWPWADTWPVARLTVPRLGVDEIVLAGASGRTMAFGPALSPAAAAPGARGNAVVSGHRDTHFAFLRELAAGDRVWLETRGGRFAYAVEAREVVDSRVVRLDTAADDARLTLVTCWPFDAVVPGGPMRYVVSARLVAEQAPALALL
jgi:sortase A